MRMAAYLPLLMHEFPDGAFTSESLSFVARECAKGFPTYPELCNYISRWWRPKRPFLNALPPPPPPSPFEPTPEEIAHVKRVVAELTASLTAHADRIDGAMRFERRGAKHLSPGVLDQVNPLPNGRRRTDVESTTTTATSEAGHDYAADNAEAVAARDDGEADAPEWFDDGIPNWP